ncbi:hypothetical protein OE88DRAFT_794894 [Heliocybe sulcata]|uniref:Uncharacterized protein n=1 Tax=Heliocybe sulcata TaxID=5364 RepID=A0A5C3MPZ2_9AGAM|nr:hypothetical protein OE88DRAFT_794894 [Heliocybe sulcata]
MVRLHTHWPISGLTFTQQYYPAAGQLPAALSSVHQHSLTTNVLFQVHQDLNHRVTPSHRMITPPFQFVESRTNGDAAPRPTAPEALEAVYARPCPPSSASLSSLPLATRSSYLTSELAATPVPHRAGAKHWRGQSAARLSYILISSGHAQAGRLSQTATA